MELIFLFRFGFGSVFQKNSLWFSLSLVRFGSKNVVGSDIIVIYDVLSINKLQNGVILFFFFKI